MSHPSRYIAYFDASYHYDKPSKYGYLIKDENGKIVKSKRGSIKFGNKSICPNVQVAEYYSLLYLIDFICMSGMKIKSIYGDNISIIKHIRGEIKSDNVQMKILRRKVRIALDRIGMDKESIVWVPREENKEADLLSKYK